MAGEKEEELHLRAHLKQTHKLMVMQKQQQHREQL
jgi:hypothetical protein